MEYKALGKNWFMQYPFRGNSEVVNLRSLKNK